VAIIKEKISGGRIRDKGKRMKKSSSFIPYPSDLIWWEGAVTRFEARARRPIRSA
jgi:hypothetical protein